MAKNKSHWPLSPSDCCVFGVRNKVEAYVWCRMFFVCDNILLCKRHLALDFPVRLVPRRESELRRQNQIARLMGLWLFHDSVNRGVCWLFQSRQTTSVRERILSCLVGTPHQERRRSSGAIYVLCPTLLMALDRLWTLWANGGFASYKVGVDMKGGRVVSWVFGIHIQYCSTCRLCVPREGA